MQDLIEDLLEISRIEMKHNMLERAEVKDILDELKLRLEYIIKERGVELVIKDKLPRIFCDRSRLTEVFVNLVSNAIKFNDKFKPLVEIGYNEKDDFYLGVTVPITTVCPCSKEISDFGAHNQRSIVTVHVRFKRFVWIEDIIHIIEECASSEVFSILKRPDEKLVTERAYTKPMFVEDVVREVASRLSLDSNITWFTVESENFESIHNHNAYAFIERGKP